MNKYIPISIAAVIIGSLVTLHYTTTKPYGTVIILNGQSAAGKSTIQKEF